MWSQPADCLMRQEVVRRTANLAVFTRQHDVIFSCSEGEKVPMELHIILSANGLPAVQIRKYACTHTHVYGVGYCHK